MHRSLCRFAAAGLVACATLLPPAASAQDEFVLTAIDRYVRTPDPSYSWKVVSSGSSNGVNFLILDMVSQNWLTPERVDRTEWRHWVTLAYPDQLRSSTGFLMIGGGKNGGDPPRAPDEMTMQIAKATGTVVAELKQVPNQPLIFNGDGKPRSEDDLIGYTWDQYIKTGDPTWLARNAMVKSAVRAMDAVTEAMASEAGGKRTVDRFVVAGGSKRGWTTWLTGAMDSRVVGIIPMVIDVLNVNQSMKHHFAAYGFWAPAIGNYVQHGVMRQMGNPRLEEMYDLVDPLSYRSRLTMPKLVLNAAGDQFFLPDSSQFYWDDLIGPKVIRYVPNADHGLKDTDALESVVAFYTAILKDRALPDFQWELSDEGIRIEAGDRPQVLRLWKATNPEARDFRVETLGKEFTSETLELNADGTLLVELPEPENGWTAYFVEATYDVGAATPLKITSGVRVVPDVLPFADKDPTQAPSVTVIARTEDEPTAQLVRKGLELLADQGRFPGAMTVLVEGERCYVNWETTPTTFQAEAAALTKFLQQNGCKQVNYQLESGPEMTLPPASAVVK